MTAHEKDRIECAIRHIQTAVDVDPWARDIAVEAMRKQIDTDGDCISRQAALKAIDLLVNQSDDGLLEPEDVIVALTYLPSVEPEYRLDENCTDCKEYDQERHCCPRFNRVIRRTVEEIRADQPEIIRCRDCKYQQRFLSSYVCKWAAFEPTDEKYCSFAERRTDG